MKVLVSADWHLDAVTAGLSRFDDLKRALEELWQAVQGCDLFVFAGDLCNPGTGRAHRAVGAAARFAAALGEAGIPGVWLPGNHDVVEDGSGAHTLLPLASVAGNQIVADKPDVYEVAGLRVLALPFVPRSHAYDPAEAIDGILGPYDIVVGHLNVTGMTPGSETKDMPRGREVFFPYELLNKRFPKALMLNGHYHAGQHWKKHRRDKQGIHIPGSLERLTFGERDNDVGWLVAERKTEWKVTAVHREARTLIEMGAAEQVWTGEGSLPSVEGALVKVVPPSGCEPQVVNELEIDLWESGAAAVKVMPPDPSAEVVTKGKKASEGWALRPKRELVNKMVKEANTKDRKALAALVGAVMDEEGL